MSDAYLRMYTFSLSCQDFGKDCKETFHGKKFEEAWETIKAHSIAEHGSTKEQLDPAQVVQMALKVCKVK